MNKLKVIPKVGLMFTNPDGDDFKVTPIMLAGEKWLSDNCTFKPANDLEWIAVNRLEWTCDEHNTITLFGGNMTNYSADGDYTRQQVEAKQRELYGLKEANMKNTKVEYVIVAHCHAWEAMKEYQEEGNLFCEVDDKFEVIPNAMSAHRAFNGCNLYRKVETELTWRDEAKANNISMMKLLSENFSTDEIKSFSHLVASLTDNPNEM